LAPGDIVIGVPTHWEELAARDKPFPADVVGVSAGAPLSREQATILMGKGCARLLDVYGASETGGIGFRDAGDAAYRLLPRWTIDASTPDGAALLDRDGTRVALPDHIHGDGATFTLGGRRDGAIQVGGHNVWPSQVETQLRRLPDVREAAVRLGSNGRLKAFVVPAGDAPVDDLVRIMSDALAAELPPHARPVAYTIGNALPLSAMGKRMDWS
jgi:4-coumarate--CoA ligase